MKKSNKRNTSYRWIPFIIIVLYTMITLLISFWGPLQYCNYNKLLVFAYVISFLFFTWFGMMVGLKSKIKQNYKITEKKRVTFRRKIATITLIVLVIKSLLLISSIKLYGFPDFSNLFTIMAITYTKKSLGIFADKNIFRQIDTFTTFLYIISVCGVLYDWEKTKKSIKVVMIINILLTLIYTIFYIGDQKPFMDVMIYILSAVLVIKVKKGKKVFSLGNSIKIVSGVVIATLFFSTIVMNRKILWGSTQSVYLGRFITLNLEHPLLALFPDSMKYQIGFFLIYPTMGWYGLSLTLQLPFEWSYFLGSARGLNSIISQFIPSVPDMYTKTYLARMEMTFGYDGLSNWHTIFPWLASDFTFIGTLIFMGCIAYIYAKSWKQTVEYDNPISFIMFSTLNIMYLYLTANNQLFVQRGSTVATFIIFGIWFLKSKYYNFRKN
ncbi:MAG: hypothetical protein HPY60_09520 [Candidatus Methanofastidiosum sp.]|nr:hypothetical protein [Methanofastidiosum sp.]